MAPEKLHWDTAFYERLSREDGDRPESDSILNQQRLLEDYCSHHPEFRVADHYSDDGFTGTNFNRPAFKRMLRDTVQAQLSKHSRTPDFEQNVGLFAGLLKCADCGRAMVKTRWNNVIRYSCGSYRRYGSSICTKHYITQKDIEAVILRDLNRIIGSVRDLNTLVREARLSDTQAEDPAQERERLEAALNRLRRFKQGCYEDYQDKLLSREEFLRYKADYDTQEQRLVQQLEGAKRKEDAPPERPWTEELLRLGGLAQLDRATVAQTVKEIRVFEDQKFEITYLFSDTLHPLLEPQLPCTR